MRATRVVRWGVLGLLLAGAVAVAVVMVASRRQRQGPLADSALSPAERYRFEGVVSKRLAADPYTYLFVEPASGPAAWVVTLGHGLLPSTSSSADTEL